MIEIDGITIGLEKRPYIIAEVGINARNDLELAERFISLAAECGADAVKFQTHLPDQEMQQEEMERIGAGDVYQTVSGCVWSETDHVRLMHVANEHDITFLSTPFSVQAIDILEDINVPALKIGSGELTNYHLLDRAARTGLPLIVSTGMHTSEDITATAEFLDASGAEFIFLYCVSNYPTSTEDFDFKTLNHLQSISGHPVGFSDHSTGVEAAKVAIGRGAVLVEKHFTIDRRLPGPDQGVSIEPEELSELCSFAKLSHDTNTLKDKLLDEEKGIKNWARHSIVTQSDIFAGQKITEEMITTKRPYTGISAKQYFDVIGREAKVDIPAETVLSEEHLSN